MVDENTQQLARAILDLESNPNGGAISPERSSTWVELVSKLVLRLRPTHNTRRYLRMPMAGRARVELSDGTPLDLEALTLGNGGMGLRGGVARLAPGTEFRITMIGIGEREEAQSLRATVKWRKGDTIGVEFEHAAPGSRPDGIYREVWTSFLTGLAVNGRRGMKIG